MRIFIGRFLPIDYVPEMVAESAMRPFQHLVIDKNQIAINSASVTA